LEDDAYLTDDRTAEQTGAEPVTRQGGASGSDHV